MRDYLAMNLMVLCLVLTGMACRPSVPMSGAGANNINAFAGVASDKATAQCREMEDMLRDNWAFKEVPDAEADAVMVVSINTPRMAYAEGHRFPLKKNRSPSTATIECRSRTWCADVVERGALWGCNGSISVCDGDATHLTVRINLGGTDREHKPYSAKEELRVPWLGQVEKHLAEGTRIAVHFESRKQQN